MKKTVIIILIIAIVEFCVCLTTLVNAFFVDESEIAAENRPTMTVTDDGTNTVNISTEINLIEQSKDTSFSNTDLISTESAEAVTNTNRKTLCLTNDITLTKDLVITADCHINLNGYTLYLSGHTLTVTHSYAGTFVIDNGFVYADTQADKIYIDTVNAVVITDVTVLMNGITQTTSDFVEVVSFDEKWLAYNIFYAVAQVLTDEKTVENDRMTYAEVYEYFTVDSNNDGNADNTDFSGMNFLPKHETCSFHGTAVAPYYCAYIFNDIDLFHSFYGYSVNIGYLSDNETVLSSTGIVEPQAGVTNVTFTVTLTDEDDTVFAEKSFNVHIVNPADDSDCAAVAEVEILDYFSNRFGSLDTDGDEIEDWSGYIIKGEMILPAVFTDFGATVVYETYDENQIKLDETTNFVDGITTEGHFRQEISNSYIFVIDTSVKYLKAKITVGTTTIETGLLPFAGDATVIKDNYTIAQAVVREWYGLNLKIYNATSGDTSAVNNYTTKILYTDVSEFLSDGITAVSYSLVNNIDGTYSIGTSGDNKLLFVTEGHDPDQLQTVFVKISFDFADDNDVQISLLVVYTPDDETGNSQIHPFLPYYTYFNRMFFTETGDNTYTTFEMAFNYSNTYPVLCFDITGDTENAISLVLYYGGVEHLLTLGENTSYTDSFDAFLTQAGLTIQNIINYGDAKWIIKIDTDKIASVDREIGLTYNYKFAVSENVWSTYATQSEFTLTGIIRCVFSDGVTTDTFGMPDTVLYKWVYDNFNPSGDVYDFATEKSTTFILADWLHKDITVDNTNNIIGVTNYKGLEFLDGTKILILKNAGITVSDMSYIAGMESLENLNLSGNNLCDYDTVSTYGFPSGDGNGFINELSVLENLKILDLSNNNIYSFEYLQNLPYITDVYTYGNTITVDTGWSGLDDILVLFLNSIYGSGGSNNLSVYQTLYEERGVRIYYLSALEYYAGGTTITDRDRLACIEYQNKLPSGASIENVYSHLSNDPSYYGITISESDTIRKVPINPDNTALGYYDFIVFSYEGSATTTDSFSITFWYQTRYSAGFITTDWVTVTVTVNFDVERIG
ncbi:MAG TPA: hypothetical protein PK675_00310 [Clostridia bacterium]|nr:hypothetical protein [Clostridia bacterium]